MRRDLFRNQAVHVLVVVPHGAEAPHDVADALRAELGQPLYDGLRDDLGTAVPARQTQQLKGGRMTINK